MVDHLRGDGADSLARKFHDHIQSRCRAKSIMPGLSVSIYSYLYVGISLICIYCDFIL